MYKVSQRRYVTLASSWVYSTTFDLHRNNPSQFERTVLVRSNSTISIKFVKNLSKYESSRPGMNLKKFVFNFYRSKRV